MIFSIRFMQSSSDSTMLFRRITVSLLATPVVWFAAVAHAGETEVDFNREVRPLLNAHCVACHGGVKQAADLSFVYEESAENVIVPG
ncbi:MAG: hypothetical protein AAFP69_16610, partial [Planctomycetota bacterium]